MDSDDADDLALLANKPTQTKPLEKAAGGFGPPRERTQNGINVFNQEGAISTLKGGLLKLVDKFMYFGSSVSSSESDVNMRLAKAWTAINRLSIKWKADLFDKIKSDFFQAAVVTLLLYGCTTRMLTKRIE